VAHPISKRHTLHPIVADWSFRSLKHAEFARLVVAVAMDEFKLKN
jgi:hypothetical protein